MTSERDYLRRLANQVAEIAELPVQEERRDLWKGHNALESERPMILIFPEGSWRELLPEDQLICEDPFYRDIEKKLRIKIYTHEHFDTDYVIEKTFNTSMHVAHTGWGLETRHTDSPDPTGAWGFQPTMKSYSDSEKLVHPEIVVDEAAAAQDLEITQELIGDILEVREKAIAHNSAHLTALFSGWRGLDQLCMDMIEAPEWVHETMAFVTEGLVNLWQAYEQQGLLSLNNEDDYHSSGGIGYTDRLPALDFDPERVRFRDVWGSTESQEMTMVSPEMHETFIMKYEAEFLKPFALNGYGCCDDLTQKLDSVCALPQMRRISISPYADVPECAERLKGDFILSWKPGPWDLVGEFNADTIRKRIRSAIEAAGEHNCVFEMILKDTHTCDHQPDRFTRWSQIAREEVERFQKMN